MYGYERVCRCGGRVVGVGVGEREEEEEELESSIHHKHRTGLDLRDRRKCNGYLLYTAHC